MRGGSLTRFRPDDYQYERGLVRDNASASLQSAWKGLKMGGPLGLPNIAGGIRGVKRGAKRAIKRKALEEINKRVKRRLGDIFGE